MVALPTRHGANLVSKREALYPAIAFSLCRPDRSRVYEVGVEPPGSLDTRLKPRPETVLWYVGVDVAVPFSIGRASGHLRRRRACPVDRAWTNRSCRPARHWRRCTGIAPDRAKTAASAQRHRPRAAGCATGVATFHGTDLRAARDQGRGQHRARRAVDREDRRTLYWQAGLDRRPRGNSPPVDAALCRPGLYQFRLYDPRPERPERCDRLPRGGGAGDGDRIVRHRA